MNRGERNCPVGKAAEASNESAQHARAGIAIGFGNRRAKGSAKTFPRLEGRSLAQQTINDAAGTYQTAGQGEIAGDAWPAAKQRQALADRLAMPSSGSAPLAADCLLAGMSGRA